MAQIARLDLKPEELELLASEFDHEITMLEGERAELLRTYELIIDNYEGNVAPTENEKPFEGASEAHLPITATDTDSVYARLMNAALGQFPLHVIKPIGAPSVEFARQTQKFSEWLEASEIPLYKTLRQAFLILAKFGSVVVYLPWVRQRERFMIGQDAAGKPLFDEIDTMNRPDPLVIHPKDWLMPSRALDLQTARWCGYRYKLGAGRLRAWIANGFFEKKTGEELLQILEPDGTKTYVGTAGEEARDDQVQRRAEENAGVTRGETPSEIDMVHLFARVDIDGDGQDEVINFHMSEASLKVPRVAFDHYDHLKRPFVDMHFFPRDGVWYSIGIPEMLLNIQKNMDVTFRQIQDSNTLKNTANLKAKLGGAIEPGETFSTSKIWYVRNMDELEPMSLGQAGVNIQIQDLNTQQLWGERRTGMTDANVRGDTGGTATAQLAGLQEAAKRIDTVIAGIRFSEAELWMQVLQLYAQFKPVTEFPVSSDGTLYTMMEWHALPPQEFRKSLLVKVSISTAALNKEIQKQHTSLLLSEYMAFNSSTLGLLQQYLVVQDPRLKEFILAQLMGSRSIMQRHLDTFEFPDAAELLPNPEDYLDQNQLPEALNPAAVVPGAGGGGGAMGTPQALLAGAGGGIAPSTAPNRSTPGLPRIPGVTGSVPGQAQGRS